MATKAEFLERAGEILTEKGFGLVAIGEDGDHLAAIRDRETSVMVHVIPDSLDNGEPMVIVRSLAVTNFEVPEGEKRLSLLNALNDLNASHYFGTWYFAPDPEFPAVVLEHSLLIDHMTVDEFAYVVGMLEVTADAFDDELSEFLQGETAKEALIGRTPVRGPGTV